MTSGNVDDVLLSEELIELLESATIDGAVGHLRLGGGRCWACRTPIRPDEGTTSASPPAYTSTSTGQATMATGEHRLWTPPSTSANSTGAGFFASTGPQILPHPHNDMHNQRCQHPTPDGQPVMRSTLGPGCVIALDFLASRGLVAAATVQTTAVLGLHSALAAKGKVTTKGLFPELTRRRAP